MSLLTVFHSTIFDTEFLVQQTIQSMKPTATSKYIRTEFKIYKTFDNLGLANYMSRRNEKSFNVQCSLFQNAFCQISVVNECQESLSFSTKFILHTEIEAR